jgi:hypothetical protein
MLPYPDDPTAMPSYEQGVKDGEAGYYPRVSRNFWKIDRDVEVAYYKGWRVGYDRWKAARSATTQPIAGG